MKRNKSLFFGSAVLLAVLWVGCPDTTPNSTNQEENNTDNGVPPVIEVDPGNTEDDALVPASKDVSTLGLANPVVISFNEGVASTVTDGAKATVSVDTNHVAVTLTAESTNIVVQGINSDGSLTFSGDYAFNLYLNGVGLTNANGAAINNTGSGEMTVSLVEGTTSRLIDGAASVDKAAFYSKGDFTVGGNGTLEVRGKASHALATKGAFSQTGGTIQVKEAVKDGVNAQTVNITGGSFSSRTVGDGIQGDESVTITGGNFNIITAADDVKAHGVKSDGDIVIGVSGMTGTGTSSPDMTITVYGSGSKGMSADGNLTIHSGELTLNTEGNGFWDTSSSEADKTSGCAGLKCDGDLLIDGGVLTLLSTGTGGKGISVDGDITISGGTLDVTTTGATYKYNSAYDTKSKAIKSDNNLTINGGTISIKTYTDGAEGLECEYALTISGGTIEINSYDDAINASGGEDGKSGRIVISGGSIFCNASNNDGIDSNGTITISGGTIISMGTTSPEEGFDCDNNTFTVTGGTLIGFGGATSKPTASTTTKSTVECNVSYSTLYHIESSDGAEIMTLKPPRSYSGTVCMLFGGGDMVKGTSYTLYSDGSVSGGMDFHGLYSGATYTKGIAVGTFTASAYATVGTASGSPGMGGQPGTPGAPPRH
ncbi:MAG: carbohydrate-binding domain-containing protein [Treponema sp.]|jgi:hypothetical protein|nr:carbohydrate-binding domain-containing protein [Treponema sp.]